MDQRVWKDGLEKENCGVSRFELGESGYLRKLSKFKVERTCPAAERIALVAVVDWERLAAAVGKSTPTNEFSASAS